MRCAWLLLLALCLQGLAWAGDADPLLLRAQATIYPKVVLLDKDLGQKTTGNTVVIMIVYRQADRDDALTMQKLIESEYRNNLGGNPLRVETVTYDDFDAQQIATAYILMNGPASAHKKVTQYASNHRRVVFSYDYKDIRNNALVSLMMKEKTYIYLNKGAMEQYDVRFLPHFYKIVKVLE